jgi:hypothetical protein
MAINMTAHKVIKTHLLLPFAWALLSFISYVLLTNLLFISLQNLLPFLDVLFPHLSASPAIHTLIVGVCVAKMSFPLGVLLKRPNP